MLKESKINMEEVLAKCEDTLNVYRKKKKEVGLLFRSIALSCGSVICLFLFYFIIGEREDLIYKLYMSVTF